MRALPRPHLEFPQKNDKFPNQDPKDENIERPEKTHRKQYTRILRVQNYSHEDGPAKIDGWRRAMDAVCVVLTLLRAATFDVPFLRSTHFNDG